MTDEAENELGRDIDMYYAHNKLHKNRFINMRIIEKQHTHWELDRNDMNHHPGNHHTGQQSNDQLSYKSAKKWDYAKYYNIVSPDVIAETSDSYFAHASQRWDRDGWL